jgi:hypothetical protein
MRGEAKPSTALGHRSDEFYGRDLVNGVDLLVGSKRSRVLGIAHHVKQPAERRFRDVRGKWFLVKGLDEGIDDRRQQPVDGAMLGVCPRKLSRLLLEGDVGPKTGMLVREPAMQLNHRCFLVGTREETTICIPKTKKKQAFLAPDPGADQVDPIFGRRAGMHGPCSLIAKSESNQTLRRELVQRLDLF